MTEGKLLMICMTGIACFFSSLTGWYLAAGDNYQALVFFLMTLWLTRQMFFIWGQRRWWTR